MHLTNEQLELMRRWFDAAQTANPGRLDTADYILAQKLYKALGMYVPGSIAEKAITPAQRDNLALVAKLRKE